MARPPLCAGVAAPRNVVWRSLATICPRQSEAETAKSHGGDGFDVDALMAAISKDGFDPRCALIVNPETGDLVNGHHRYVALRRLGFSEAPVVLLRRAALIPRAAPKVAPSPHDEAARRRGGAHVAVAVPTLGGR